jgi:signal transduction histidine kinase
VQDFLEVAPSAASFEIQYVGLSFVNPEGVRFRYRLEGWDSAGLDAGNRRTAYYNHVAPGDYTFTVIAANRDGVWNNEGRSLQIVVVPPFWKTSWFQTLTALCLVASAIGLYRWRVKRIHKEHALRQAHARQLNASQERERQRIAKDLHDGLGQSLVIIRSQALRMLASADDPQFVGEHLREIADAAAHAEHEATEIAYNLRPRQLDVLGLAEAINAMVRKASDVGGIAFASHVDAVTGLFHAEAQIDVYRVVQEAVNNILKHSNATEATIVASRSSGHVEIVVRDNGRGFTSEDRRDISVSSGGFGLTGIAERVNILGGKHSIRSTPGQGVTVTITVPVAEEHHERR